MEVKYLFVSLRKKGDFFHNPKNSYRDPHETDIFTITQLMQYYTTDKKLIFTQEGKKYKLCIPRIK